MKKILIILFLLTGCQTAEPPSVITYEATKQEVVSVKKSVEKIKEQTPKECQTDLFLNNLETLEEKINTISRNIEIINESCKTEKELINKDLQSEKLKFYIAVCVEILLLIFIIWRAIK